MADDSAELELQIGQLRQTVLALRGSLEQHQIQAEQQLQAQAAAHDVVKQQLITTIDVLRRQLEQQAEDHRGALQQERALAAEEKRQLQQAIVQQRTLLEPVSYTHLRAHET